MSVVGNDLLNPGHVVTHCGIDTRVVLLGTPVAPGHHPRQLSITDHWPTGVSLQGTKSCAGLFMALESSKRTVPKRVGVTA